MVVGNTSLGEGGWRAGVGRVEPKWDLAAVVRGGERRLGGRFAEGRSRVDVGFESTFWVGGEGGLGTTFGREVVDTPRGG